jgi:hypothetical protein
MKCLVYFYRSCNRVESPQIVFSAWILDVFRQSLGHQTWLSRAESRCGDAAASHSNLKPDRPICLQFCLVDRSVTGLPANHIQDIEIRSKPIIRKVRCPVPCFFHFGSHLDSFFSFPSISLNFRSFASKLGAIDLQCFKAVYKPFIIFSIGRGLIAIPN